MIVTTDVPAAASPRPMSSLLRSRWLWGVVAVALVLRVALVIGTPNFSPLEDSAAYDINAVQLVTNGSFAPSLETLHAGASAYFPPGFSLLLAGVYELSGTGAHARWDSGRVTEAVLGAIAVLLIALIAARLFGRRTALIAGAIAAVWPPLILVGSSLLSESLFIPLVLGAVLTALIYRDDRRSRWLLLSGVLIGLAALTRGNGLFVAIPVAFLVWVDRPRLWWRHVTAPALVIVATLVVLVPWTIRNAEVFHRFVPVSTDVGFTLAGTFNATAQAPGRPFPAMWEMPQGHIQQLYAQHPRTNEAAINDTLLNEALTYVGHHPSSVLKTWYWGTVRLLDLTPAVERFYAPFERYPTWLAMLSVYTFWVLALAVIAALASRPARRALRAAPPALWGVPLALYLTTVLLNGTTRGRVPLDPFLILVVAVGASKLARHAPQLGRSSPRQPAV
jgi:4-amino-4-deoxy-L-arabinose transferase-like glycosyltransferase